MILLLRISNGCKDVNDLGEEVAFLMSIMAHKEVLKFMSVRMQVFRLVSLFTILSSISSSCGMFTSLSRFATLHKTINTSWIGQLFYKLSCLTIDIAETIWNLLNSKHTYFPLSNDSFEWVHDESNGINDSQHPNPSIKLLIPYK